MPPASQRNMISSQSGATGYSETHSVKGKVGGREGEVGVVGGGGGGECTKILFVSFFFFHLPNQGIVKPFLFHHSLSTYPMYDGKDEVRFQQAGTHTTDTLTY